MKFNNYEDAYDFLSRHPINSQDNKSYPLNHVNNHFKDCLDVERVKVNPNKMDSEGNCYIDDNEELNTKDEVWLEYGGWCYCEEFGRCLPSHDIDLDCGGDTYEEAIINLANLVYENENYKIYNNYREKEGNNE